MPPKTKPKTNNDNAFGIDADPDEFSIDDWLNGASLPARSVKIYQAPGLRAEYDELEQEFIALSMKLDDDQGKGGDPDRALGEASPRSRRIDIAQRMKDIIDATEDDAIHVRVRGITEDEEVKTAKKKLEGDAIYYEALSFAGRVVIDGQEQPPLSAAKWKKFRDAVGRKQFRKIVSALDSVTGYADDQVMPDFSVDASALLATKES